jgi:membrane protein DedA with SNARE-associated domain
MSDLSAYVAELGLPLVFANVLLQQLGLPIPALPTLVVAGSLAADGKFSLLALYATALAAVLVADSIWYQLGRRHGRRVLRLVCQVSLSPESCVRRTEQIFQRWGLRSIAMAKFVPGFSMVAPPLAGAMRAGVAPFLFYDCVAGLLWSSVGIGAGLVFHHEVDSVLAFLAGLGVRALVGLLVLLSAFVAWKWWQRRRFFRALRMARISVEELDRLLRTGQPPVVLDVRSALERGLEPRRIPGAIALELPDLDGPVAGLSREREVVLYCT